MNIKKFFEIAKPKRKQLSRVKKARNDPKSRKQTLYKYYTQIPSLKIHSV